jgi:hypothetical protein
VAIVRLPIVKASGTYALAWRLPSATNIDVPAGSTQVYQSVETGFGSLAALPGKCTSIRGSLNPFELLSFTARPGGLQVLLNWSMGADSKVKSFDVERSSRTNVWTAIGTVNGLARAGAAAQTFAYADKDISGMNTILYRLKMTDANGTVKYSSSVKVQIGNAAAAPQLLASYPNPFNPMTTVRFSVPGTMAVTVTVFDDAGKEIMRLCDNEMLDAGEYTRTFNGTNLASGKYLLRMVAGDYIATENLILNK